jgi:hypothetical protein
MAKSDYPTVEDWINEALDAEQMGFPLCADAFFEAALAQERSERLESNNEQWNKGLIPL